MVFTPLNWYRAKYVTNMINGFNEDGLIRSFKVSVNVGFLHARKEHSRKIKALRTMVEIVFEIYRVDCVFCTKCCI